MWALRKHYNFKLLPHNGTCGREYVFPAHGSKKNPTWPISRMYGGVPVRLGKYPWMAHITSCEYFRTFCLLSIKFLLKLRTYSTAIIVSTTCFRAFSANFRVFSLDLIKPILPRNLGPKMLVYQQAAICFVYFTK